MSKYSPPLAIQWAFSHWSSDRVGLPKSEKSIIVPGQTAIVDCRFAMERYLHMILVTLN